VVIDGEPARESDMDIVVAGTYDNIIMVEGGKPRVGRSRT